MLTMTHELQRPDSVSKATAPETPATGAAAGAVRGERSEGRPAAAGPSADSSFGEAGGFRRWLNRARALRAAEDWSRLLELLKRGYVRGVRSPNLMVLGAEAALQLNRPAEAVRFLSRAEAAGELPRTGRIASLKGQVLLRIGSYDHASKWLMRALKEARDSGAWEAEARVAETLGAVAVKRERFRAALSWYDRAAGLYETNDAVPDLARVLYATGRVHRRLNQLDRALECAERAERCLEGRPIEDLRARVLTLIAEVNLARGVPSGAVGPAVRALKLFHQLGNPRAGIETLRYLGLALQARGREREARLCFERLKRLRQAGHTDACV